MEPQDLAPFISQLKGASLAILVVMVNLDRPTGPNEVADATGYAACTARAGLRHLAMIGLARRHARYQGWVLTPQAMRYARQLGWRPGGPAPAAQDGPETAPDAATGPAEGRNAPLPDSEPAPVGVTAPLPAASPPTGGDREADNSSLDRKKRSLSPCSRGSTHGSFGVSSTRQRQTHHEPRTTTCKAEGQNLPVEPPGGHRRAERTDPEVEAAVEALQACGCPVRTRHGRGARDAVERALAHGWTGAEVRAAVEGWLRYAESPAGRTIKHKGFFTMSRLRLGEPAPPGVEAPEVPASMRSAADRDAQARAYIEAQYERIVRR